MVLLAFEFDPKLSNCGITILKVQPDAAAGYSRCVTDLQPLTMEYCNMDRSCSNDSSFPIDGFFPFGFFINQTNLPLADVLCLAPISLRTFGTPSYS